MIMAETKRAYDAPSGYGQQPLHEQQPQYGQQSQYGQPSYDQQPYGSHAAAPSGPLSGPPGVAPGWTAQWDANSQRWYYLEQATGRTQWDPPPFQPAYGAYPSSGPGNVEPPNSYNRDAPHGTPYGGQPYESGQYGTHQGQYPAQPFGEQQKEKKKKDKGHGGLMAGAAGGLAVGAVGGALVGHAMGIFFPSPRLPSILPQIKKNF